MYLILLRAYRCAINSEAKARILKLAQKWFNADKYQQFLKSI